MNDWSCCNPDLPGNTGKDWNWPVISLVCLNDNGF